MDSEYKELLEQAYKLALKYPDLGILQELQYLNKIELESAIQMMKRSPSS